MSVIKCVSKQKDVSKNRNLQQVCNFGVRQDGNNEYKSSRNVK